MAEPTVGRSSSVRQLCLKLKPILGETIDQIYGAYCAEDAEGKKDIETYLELLAAIHLPDLLEPELATLLPPSKEQAAGEYQLGNVVYAGKELYPFGLREDEWIQHVAVFGRSGAGKTNTGFLILKTLKAKNKPFLLFDWKRNYRDLLTLPGFDDVEIYTIGRDVASFGFNPLIPPQGTDPKTWLKKLNEIIAHAYCLGNGVLYLLQQAVDAVYEEAGVYDQTVQRWPTFKDVLAKARTMDTRGRESGWLSSTLRALSTLCFGDMDRVVNSTSNQSVDHILDKSVVLELDALTQSDKTFFVQAILLYLHHKRMTEPRREDFRQTVVIEEAHHVLADERRSLVGGQSVMDIFFREVREYGVAILCLDQNPSKISLYALGNTYTTICLNQKHKTDINAMGQSMLLDRDRDILGTLEVGEAVVKLQGRTPRAFQIRIPHVRIDKGSVNDEMIRQHMQQLVPALYHGTQPSEPVSSIIKPAIQTPLDDPKIRAFLSDIQDYPESGIAQRYKRLGLSVRQGQKLKTLLLGKDLICESLQIRSSGRLKVVKLTDKAKGLIADESGKHRQ